MARTVWVDGTHWYDIPNDWTAPEGTTRIVDLITGRDQRVDARALGPFEIDEDTGAQLILDRLPHDPRPALVEALQGLGSMFEALSAQAPGGSARSVRKLRTRRLDAWVRGLAEAQRQAASRKPGATDPLRALAEAQAQRAQSPQVAAALRSLPDLLEADATLARAARPSRRDGS